MLLAASAFVVAPAYLYLGVLRARERPVALLAFPTAMILTLAGLAPWFAARMGLEGVAVAWLVANAPFGLYAAMKLRALARHPAPAPARDPLDQEVTPHPAPTVGGAPHLE